MSQCLRIPESHLEKLLRHDSSILRHGKCDVRTRLWTVVSNQFRDSIIIVNEKKSRSLDLLWKHFIQISNQRFDTLTLNFQKFFSSSLSRNSQHVQTTRLTKRGELSLESYDCVSLLESTILMFRTCSHLHNSWMRDTARDCSKVSRYRNDLLQDPIEMQSRAFSRRSPSFVQSTKPKTRTMPSQQHTLLHQIHLFCLHSMRFPQSNVSHVPRRDLWRRDAIKVSDAF